jgi:hypothetical protein
MPPSDLPPPFSVEQLWIPLWNFSRMPIAEGHATYCLIIGHPAGGKNQCGIDDSWNDFLEYDGSCTAVSSALFLIRP